jgi:hypothetical protein
VEEVELGACTGQQTAAAHTILVPAVMNTTSNQMEDGELLVTITEGQERDTGEGIRETCVHPVRDREMSE